MKMIKCFILICLLLDINNISAQLIQKKEILDSFETAKQQKDDILLKHHFLIETIEQIDTFMKKRNISFLTNERDLNFVLSVYNQLVQATDSIFADSNSKKHIIFYELNDAYNIYNKNLALLHHAYILTKNSDYAKTAFLLTENYKSIELWQKDSIKGEINILHKKKLPEIQKKMTVNQAFVSYHCGISKEKTDSSYAFVFTKDSISFQSITVDTTIINQYINELNHFGVSKHYTQYAYRLYQNLVAPLSINNNKTNIDELIIIASGYLSLIPFEALLTKNNNETNFAKMSYLLQKYAISYDLSLPFWNEQKSNLIIKEAVSNFLVVSPDFSTTNLTPLQYNTNLAEKISQNYQKTTLLNKSKATIVNFKQAAQQANIIHLASHASLATDDVAERHIVLSDGNLLSSHFTNTIFQNCDLAVLACCDTGNGKYEQGVGIRSLNYDFRKHGAKCVLATLWSVDDKATSVLLKDFYFFLEQGKRKSIALQAAKLKYLKETEYDTPYFWAGLVLNGQNNAIALQNNTFVAQSTLDVLYVLIVFFLFLIIMLTLGVAKTKQ
ncbi:MAG: CHAT domain-containing protein [Chitinophagales bacterium]